MRGVNTYKANITIWWKPSQTTRRAGLDIKGEETGIMRVIYSIHSDKCLQVWPSRYPHLGPLEKRGLKCYILNNFLVLGGNYPFQKFDSYCVLQRGR